MEQLSFLDLTSIAEQQIENKKKIRKQKKQSRERTEDKQIEFELDDTWRGHPDAGSVIRKNGKFYYVIALYDKNGPVGNAYFKTNFRNMSMRVMDADGHFDMLPIGNWIRYEDVTEDLSCTSVIEQLNGENSIEWVKKHLKEYENGSCVRIIPEIPTSVQKKIIHSLKQQDDGDHKIYNYNNIQSEFKRYIKNYGRNFKS